MDTFASFDLESIADIVSVSPEFITQSASPAYILNEGLSSSPVDMEYQDGGSTNFYCVIA